LSSLRDFFAGSSAAAQGDPHAETYSPAPGGEQTGRWQEQVPPPAYERVLAIRELILGLEKTTAERGMQAELDELGRIRSTHLPQLLQSYIEIPPEHRAEVFRETGRSASFLLCDSLDKMLARLRDLSAQAARGNITTFAENIRFVDLYYDRSNGPFD
jgi:hypothetical protein